MKGGQQGQRGFDGYLRVSQPAKDAVIYTAETSLKLRIFSEC